jgi:hypothetical protein
VGSDTVELRHFSRFLSAFRSAPEPYGDLLLQLNFFEKLNISNRATIVAARCQTGGWVGGTVEITQEPNVHKNRGDTAGVYRVA